jgi:Fe-S cluster assembly iron-binding protein IscA
VLNSEFVFNNPNIKGTCGCGESFTVWYNIVIFFSF